MNEHTLKINANKLITARQCLFILLNGIKVLICNFENKLILQVKE